MDLEVGQVPNKESTLFVSSEKKRRREERKKDEKIDRDKNGERRIERDG